MYCLPNFTNRCHQMPELDEPAETEGSAWINKVRKPAKRKSKANKKPSRKVYAQAAGDAGDTKDSENGELFSRENMWLERDISGSFNHSLSTDGKKSTLTPVKTSRWFSFGKARDSAKTLNKLLPAASGHFDNHAYEPAYDGLDQNIDDDDLRVNSDDELSEAIQLGIMSDDEGEMPGLDSARPEMTPSYSQKSYSQK